MSLKVFSCRITLCILVVLLSISLNASASSKVCKPKGKHSNASKFTKHSKHLLNKTKTHRKNSSYHKNSKNSNNKNTTTVKTPSLPKTKPILDTPTTKEGNDTSDSIRSLLSVTSICGSSNPSKTITENGGPNGCQDFFNCGITNQNGWKPGNVKMSMLKTVSLDDSNAKSTFQNCEKYKELFNKYGEKYNTSFAMQESSCNPNARGDNGGAFGLMQITQDKCGNAPNGDCADPDYNVMMGAKTFADGLSSSQGNVLIALGAYNGWYEGLTKDKAIAAKANGCCECQQNLDYLQQFLNGWILGVNPYNKHLGTMRNLDSCGNQS